MPSHIYIAPWEWVAPPDRRPHWQAPGGGALGALDLRSQPQYSQPGPVPEGCGLFVYPQETRIPGGYYLGSDPQRQLTVLDRSALEAFLGVRVAETQLLRTLRELLLVHADPTGQDRWKGVVLDSRRRMRLVLGAFGQLIDEAVGVGHPCLDLTLAVRWADYRRNREDGLPLAVLQRWTGYDMLRVYGRMGDDLLPALVPPEYQADGWRSPRTVFTDTFVDTNGTGINVHTPTPDGGFAWVYV